MIKIIEDSSSEMIQISYNDKCIFEGNFHDFPRDSEGFYKLFKQMDLNVEVIEKNYENWY